MKVESPDLALDGRPAVSMLELYTSVWRFAAGGRASVGSQTIKPLVPWLTAQAIDTESQFLYLQNLVNVIGPLVALTIMSAWVGALAAIGYIAVAVVIVHFDRRLMRLLHRQNLLERRYAVRLLNFLGNISTVLSLRLQNMSRRLIGERLADVLVPARRLIVLIEAKWCAVDLLTVALSWLLVIGSR